ncbi:MAG: Holliday junction resolvase RuvX [Calditrichaeota bacterium]|nr:MAG: Holliday junction resolvase RuvX [Calditrichota bacterium]
MRILAIDFGEKRVGLALSDPTGVIAQGLPTIEYRGQRHLLSELGNIVRKYDVEKVVVGLPLTMKGERAAAAEKTEEFVAKLEATLAIPVETWDERLTSRLAERTMLACGQSPSRKKSKVDEIAAMLLLQSYLDRKGSVEK